MVIVVGFERVDAVAVGGIGSAATSSEHIDMRLCSRNILNSKIYLSIHPDEASLSNIQYRYQQHQ